MSSDVADQLRLLLGVPDRVGSVPVAQSDRQSDSLREYFAGGFTGAEFERHGRERLDPNSITSDDLIAVTLLSIAISNRAAGDIEPQMILKLESVRDRVSALLEQWPQDRDLHTLSTAEFEKYMGPGSPGDKLHRLLRTEVGIPRVATHKLVARKRPRLAPVRDTVVEDLLKLSKSPTCWQPWWSALKSDQRITDRLAAIRLKSQVDDVSLLRVADIVLWMHGRKGNRTMMQPSVVTSDIGDDGP